MRADRPRPANAADAVHDSREMSEFAETGPRAFPETRGIRDAAHGGLGVERESIRDEARRTGLGRARRAAEGAGPDSCPRTPDDPGTDRPSNARSSFLTSLFSFSVEALPWTRGRPPPASREQAGRDEIKAQSMPMGLLSLSTRLRRPARRGEIETTIMAALVHVDYYEDRDTRQPADPDAPRARSVGLSYREIRRRVRVKHPGGRVPITTIRSCARDAKREGRPLPYRRPYSRRRTGGSGPS